MKISLISLHIFLLIVCKANCMTNTIPNENSEFELLLDDLRCAYTLNICYESNRINATSIVCDYNLLNNWNKSIEEYKNDSIKLNKAIKSFYAKDQVIIKFLKEFREVMTPFPNFYYFSNRNLIYQNDSRIVNKIYTFYIRTDNAYLDLILNYYLNIEQKTIKLLLNADYIRSNKILTEDLYDKLDKIFEKYGYEDIEKIRQAILEDFGSCITLEGM